MNDEHDADPDGPTSDPDVDPDQDARIRALLAELGSGPDGESLPPEVEARLDDTLALLVAERGRAAGGHDHVKEGDEDAASDSGTDNVVPFRRRWLPRAGAAAAAVIVLGVGSLAVANLSGLSQSGQQSSSDSAGASAPEAESGAESRTESKSGSSSGSDSSTGATQLPDLSAASFESDVSVLLQGRASMLASEGEGAEEGKAAGEGKAADEPLPNSRDNSLPGAPGVLPSRDCQGPEVTDGADARLVRYDGRRAVLLVHPERGGRLLVEAWSCEGDRRLASTKIKP